MAESKSKARQKFLSLETPNPDLSSLTIDRVIWINQVCQEFVQPSVANKAYYRVIIETLWPEGHGIPGPYISEEQIREAIDQFRRENRYGKDPDKPYVDVFRRVRELQGEEGLIGVARQGKTFQLVDLTLGNKRVPRTKLSNGDWELVKKRFNNKCACCGKKEPNVRFQQDHKIPRTREGNDSLENWQPLCDECNNFKSVSCRGCSLDCITCCWAFPEKHRPIKINNPKVLTMLIEYCDKHNYDIDTTVEKLVYDFLCQQE